MLLYLPVIHVIGDVTAPAYSVQRFKGTRLIINYTPVREKPSSSGGTFSRGDHIPHFPICSMSPKSGQFLDPGQPRDVDDYIYCTYTTRIFFQEYLDTDPSGRNQNTTSVYQIKMGAEPINFTAFFHAWDPQKWEVRTKPIDKSNVLAGLFFWVVNFDTFSVSPTIVCLS